MTDCTTNFDVLEEALGFPLSPENTDRIRDIQYDDVRRAADMVWDHVNADYFAMPRFDDAVGVCNPLSDLGGRLGGYAGAHKQFVDGTPEQLVGNIYFSLLTNDRLALPDGLQYVFDYYAHSRKPPNHDELLPTVKRVLATYATLGDLFRNRQLFILPATVNDQHRHAVRLKLYEERDFLLQLADTPFVRGRSRTAPIHPDLLAEVKEQFPESHESDHSRLLGAKVIAGSTNAAGLLGNLLVARSFGYRPILEGNIEHAVFDSLARLRIEQAKQARAAITMPEAPILLPHFGRLPPAEFAALKRSGDAERVARTIAKIENQAAGLSDRPIEMKEMLEYELDQAAKALDKTVKSSTVLSEVVKETTKVIVGFFAGASVGVMYPAFHNDPIKILMAGVIGGTASFSGSIIQKYWDGDKTRPAVQTFVKLKQMVAESAN